MHDQRGWSCRSGNEKVYDAIFHMQCLEYKHGLVISGQGTAIARKSCSLKQIAKKYGKFLAASEPEHEASMGLLEKVGFKKSEFKKGFYEWAINGGLAKSELQYWYLEQPVK
jgi:hypothetical protein